jgi:hypothetical protein
VRVKFLANDQDCCLDQVHRLLGGSRELTQGLNLAHWNCCALVIRRRIEPQTFPLRFKSEDKAVCVLGATVPGPNGPTKYRPQSMILASYEEERFLEGFTWTERWAERGQWTAVQGRHGHENLRIIYTVWVPLSPTWHLVSFTLHFNYRQVRGRVSK